MATPTPARYSLEGRTEKNEKKKKNNNKNWPDSKFGTLMVPDPQPATHEKLHNDNAVDCASPTVSHARTAAQRQCRLFSPPDGGTEK